jgi:hypothetical protein
MNTTRAIKRACHKLPFNRRRIAKKVAKSGKERGDRTAQFTKTKPICRSFGLERPAKPSCRQSPKGRDTPLKSGKGMAE